MSTDLAALVGESYERAYTDMVRVQQLTELEEVIAYQRAAVKKATAVAAQTQAATAAALVAAAAGGADGSSAAAIAAAAAAGGGVVANGVGGVGAAAGGGAGGADAQMQFIRGLWRRRLMGVQRNVEVWQSLFSVRNLVVPMHEGERPSF
jgi:FKBP12-rapamycin complex-associated protein